MVLEFRNSKNPRFILLNQFADAFLIIKDSIPYKKYLLTYLFSNY